MTLIVRVTVVYNVRNRSKIIMYSISVNQLNLPHLCSIQPKTDPSARFDALWATSAWDPYQ